MIAILLALGAGSDTAVRDKVVSRPSREVSPERIARFRLCTPDGKQDIEQGSDLCYGRVEQREGLWLVCDRNGGPTAGRIFRISMRTLGRAVPGGVITADEYLVVTPPAEGWEAFAGAHPEVPGEVVDDLRGRIEGSLADEDWPRLDLEAISIAPATVAGGKIHLFVSAEEPYSAILELAPVGNGPQAAARLVSVHLYPEAEDERGGDYNDGLEGLAWAGEAGVFYWVEEGTQYHGGRPGPRLFLRDPRVGRGRFKSGRLEIELPLSDRLTAAVRALRKGSEQTLNALTALPGGHLLAVDRNGGWILRLDPTAGTAERWLNLYAIDGVDLREFLGDFPAPRVMPYVSIEGIAIDSQGDIWLIDDPAMPEAFHASCLVRLRGFKPDGHPSTRSARTSSDRP